MNNLGLTLRAAGRLDGAIDAHTHSHEVAKAPGDRLRAAMALSNLANALLVAGRSEKVIQMHAEALEIYKEFGDWFRTGQSLNNLAIAHQAAQHPVEAHAYWLMAVDAYNRANAPEQAARSQSRADSLT
ncbi:tetratricopeptide repeat protein [Streptomyces actinomycinicus]|uniref:Tetratricopeptide repeat protein n=1 Tax=Streptomyces actinomycinicus TaxID=1695166 RepID=A0A937JQT2_9ACTN|nr:tetratricopeptide repeat protein [Streptomyces actinomycinicus]MBL1085736.1 tetratricopeptide repeat protein [Streptomyces actinomycinicus]